jgi:hypothetical protein
LRKATLADLPFEVLLKIFTHSHNRPDDLFRVLPLVNKRMFDVMCSPQLKLQRRRLEFSRRFTSRDEIIKICSLTCHLVEELKFGFDLPMFDHDWVDDTDDDSCVSPWWDEDMWNMLFKHMRWPKLASLELSRNVPDGFLPGFQAGVKAGNFPLLKTLVLAPIDHGVGWDVVDEVQPILNLEKLVIKPSPYFDEHEMHEDPGFAGGDPLWKMLRKRLTEETG